MKSRLSVPLATVVALAGVASAALADDDVTRRDITTTETRQTELSQVEIDRARAWSLNESEWRRYQRLMRGIRGSVSAPNLSPIEVLGIHARDAAERREYAERWAAAMHDDAERILLFQRAYDKATNRLYPGQRIIDTARLFDNDNVATALQSGDRLIVRIALDCPSCDAVVQKALRRLNDIGGIDIQFVGTDEMQRDQIREWAKSQAIQPEWVRTRRMTLNIVEQTGLEPDDDESLPALYIRSGENIKKLAYSAL